MMTRGTTKGVSEGVPRGLAKGASLPPEIAAPPEGVTIHASKGPPGFARIEWSIGNLEEAWLETSTDLKTWVEVRRVTSDASIDEPINPFERRRFWRLRY